MKANKYIYYYVIQGNYGYGWDDLSFRDKHDPSTSYKDVKAELECYQENEKGAKHRIINRRELNERNIF